MGMSAISDGLDRRRPVGALVARRPIAAYLVLACAASWAWWLPMALTGSVARPGVGWPTHLPGLLGPALAAVAVTAASLTTATEATSGVGVALASSVVMVAALVIAIGWFVGGRRRARTAAVPSDQTRP